MKGADIKENLKNLKKVCMEREKTTPFRGKEYDIMIQEINNFCVLLKENIKKENLNIPNQKLEYVFIAGQMKSGTSLMLGILDDHSDVFCFPGDTRVIKNNFLKDKSLNFWISRFITPTGMSPFCLFENNPEVYFDIAKIISDNENLNIVDQFKLLSQYFAYKFNKKIIVEKTPENEFFYNEFSKHFDNFKMINVYRHPFENMVSQKLLSIKRRDIFNMPHRANVYFNSLKIANLLSEKDNFISISYNEMIDLNYQKILNFLNIKDEASLRISTSLGIPKKKNTMRNNFGNNGEIKKAENNSFKTTINTLSRQEIIYLYNICNENQVLLNYFGFERESILNAFLKT